MSVNRTVVDDNLYDYIRNNFSDDSDYLNRIQADAIAKQIPTINIAPEQIIYLQSMIYSLNAKFVIEFGTLFGYSSIGMASAMQSDSKLITLEINEKHYELSKQNIVNSGLSNIIEIRNQSGIEFLNTYNFTQEIDLVFADADKNNYINYLDLTLPHLRKGGMFIADNAFAFGNIAKEVPDRNPESVKNLREFNDYMNNHPQFHTTIVPLGDGLIIGVKK